VTSLATVATIVLAIFSQAQLIIGMAKGTVPVAGALFLRLVAHDAFELFPEHQITLLLVPTASSSRLAVPEQEQDRRQRRASQNYPRLFTLSATARAKSSPVPLV